MSWITARRRRPVAGYAVVLLGLILVGAIYAVITGSAAVDFQVSTGRMPAKEIGSENGRKPAQLNPTETKAVAAYIASLAGGPAIPTPAEVSTSPSSTMS